MIEKDDYKKTLETLFHILNVYDGDYLAACDYAMNVVARELGKLQEQSK